jgi:hypothetical protein
MPGRSPTHSLIDSQIPFEAVADDEVTHPPLSFSWIEEDMTSDRDLDLKALLSAIMSEDEIDPVEEAEPEAPMSAFGLRLAAAVRAAVEQMRREGNLEVEDAEVDALIDEVTEAGLDSNSPKQLTKKVLHTLLNSDRVEEIYGTDEMLKATLAIFLGQE